LGFGIWETSHDIKALQTNNATKENVNLLINNEIKSPLDIDDHDIHIAEHTAFMLGSELEKAMKKKPYLLESMLNHVKEHKSFLENLNKVENEK